MPVKRFLVADEVGLGKTMVAKGLIAKTVEHLWDTDKRIDVVYICSNSQIARQNLSRLKVVDGHTVKHADRLTLLPKVIRNLRDNTSQLRLLHARYVVPGRHVRRRSPGARAALLDACDVLGSRRSLAAPRWKKFFEGAVESRETSSGNSSAFDRSSLDDELCQSFGEAVESAIGPDGGPLREELEACAEDFNYLRSKPSNDLSGRRNRLVGKLRQLVARAAVHHLEPDLVILDEFQRFKDLLDADDEGAELANAIFDHPDAKVLLLSATPYKMYTLPDEPEGDDHYRDFIRTVRFLADDERAHIVERELRTMRESLFSGGDHARASEAKAEVERELRRVMCRTERLSSTVNRDGMLDATPYGRSASSGGGSAVVADVRRRRTARRSARRLRVLALDPLSAQPHGPQQLPGTDQVPRGCGTQRPDARHDAPRRARAARLGRHPALPPGRPRQRKAAWTQSMTCWTGAHGNWPGSRRRFLTTRWPAPTPSRSWPASPND